MRSKASRPRSVPILFTTHFCTFHLERLVKQSAGERRALRKHTDRFPSFILRDVKILCAPTPRAAGSRVCDARDALTCSDERAIFVGHVRQTQTITCKYNGVAQGAPAGGAWPEPAATQGRRYANRDYSPLLLSATPHQSVDSLLHN